jgi:hypothetical protein
MYFPWNVISKKYFSWTVMRPISSTQRCVSGNICKQTLPEIACTRLTIMIFLHETSLIRVISLGGEIMASLLPIATHMQKLSY